MILQPSTRDGVATLRLNRPERGNALSRPMVTAIHAALDEAIANPDVHTMLFRGAGPNFCTGFDIAELEAETDAALAERFTDLEALLQAIWHAPVRTIAMATGRAWGAGADLFASCDVRAAAPDSTYRFPGSAFGIVLGTRRLVESIGWDRARPFVTDGASCDAAGAMIAGIATDIAEGDIETWVAKRCLPPVADRPTFAAIRAATRADHRSADMACLKASASRPGLKARIAAYRERIGKAR